VKRTRNREINGTNEHLNHEKKSPYKNTQKSKMKDSLSSLEIDGRKLIPPETKIINRTIMMSETPTI